MENENAQEVPLDSAVNLTFDDWGKGVVREAAVTLARLAETTNSTLLAALASALKMLAALHAPAEPNCVHINNSLHSKYMIACEHCFKYARFLPQKVIFRVMAVVSPNEPPHPVWGASCFGKLFLPSVISNNDTIEGAEAILDQIDSEKDALGFVKVLENDILLKEVNML